MANVGSRRTNTGLVVEIILVFVLVAAATYLYWRPAAGDNLAPEWWHWIAMAGLFFLILTIHFRRGKYRVNRDLHRAIHDDAETALNPPVVDDGPAAGDRSAAHEPAARSLQPDGAPVPVDGADRVPDRPL